MSPNGRRAWRVAAKKLRRKIGRRVRDLDHRSTPISGAWFRRHGFTMDDPRYQIRQYIGTCGTVDGDGVEFAIKPASFTPRSLVGMTMGARKRKAWVAYQSGLFLCTDESWSDLRSKHLIGQKLRPCPGCCACRSHMLTYRELRRWYPTAQRRYLQSFVTRKSWLCGSAVMDEGDMQTYHLSNHCDGSGVLPARRSK